MGPAESGGDHVARRAPARRPSDRGRNRESQLVRAYPRLVEAAAWIEASLAQAGYKVRRLGYEVRGRDLPQSRSGDSAAGRSPEEIVIIGAHYDSVFGCPAANDNGSGVAALLALARAFADAKPERTHPLRRLRQRRAAFYHTKSEMGSLVYARECRRRGDKVVAMLSLETIGYYRDEERQPDVSRAVSLFYPSEGNFIAFVGNVRSLALVQRCLATFRREAKFPSEGAALPGS